MRALVSFTLQRNFLDRLVSYLFVFIHLRLYITGMFQDLFLIEPLKCGNFQWIISPHSINHLCRIFIHNDYFGAPL